MKWPSQLPQCLQIRSFQGAPISNAIATSMDAGPEFRRPRYTMQTRKVSGSVVMSRDQLNDFRDFWKDDLNYGISDFVWEDMIDEGIDYTVRLSVSNEPVFTPLGGGYWEVSLNLEIMKEEDA